MRVLLLAIGLACSGAAPALETARELAQGGAPRLALDRVERLQPRAGGEPRWAEWEALRLELLLALGRGEEALARAARLPRTMTQRELAAVLALAARAAVAAGRGELARAHAARALWEAGAGPEEARALRLTVIESYVAEGNADAAFRTMLRFSQDYQPLEHATAARFVWALLELGMAREAANWLGRLDEGSAPKLLLLLRTGLLEPGAALEQARARLAQGSGPDYWRVVAEAAGRRGDAPSGIEALEHVLHLAERGAGAAARAGELWRAYLAEARAAANRARLLAGDDPAWAEYAARRLDAEPPVARAIVAHLARGAQSPELRGEAQRALVAALEKSGLDGAALRLFEHAGIDIAALDPAARYRLGAIAEARHELALALRFWEGLGAPEGASAADWQLRLALALWRAGDAEAALGALRRAAARKVPLAGGSVGRAVTLAEEMAAAGRVELAETALESLLPLAGTGEQRTLLSALGRAAEAAGRFAAAAGYHLRSALLAGAHAPDAAALAARLAAAQNLARAGYREDARAQFEWVLRHSRDAAQREIARRGLARL